MANTKEKYGVIPVTNGILLRFGGKNMGVEANRIQKLTAIVDLERSLHEATTKELLYFMAKILEELNRREK